MASFLLKEDGGLILQETNDRLIIEPQVDELMISFLGMNASQELSLLDVSTTVTILDTVTDLTVTVGTIENLIADLNTLLDLISNSSLEAEKVISDLNSQLNLKQPSSLESDKVVSVLLLITVQTFILAFEQAINTLILRSTQIVNSSIETESIISNIVINADDIDSSKEIVTILNLLSNTITLSNLVAEVVNSLNLNIGINQVAITQEIEKILGSLNIEVILNNLQVFIDNLINFLNINSVILDVALDITEYLILDITALNLTIFLKSIQKEIEQNINPFIVSVSLSIDSLGIEEIIEPFDLSSTLFSPETLEIIKGLIYFVLESDLEEIEVFFPETIYKTKFKITIRKQDKIFLNIKRKNRHIRSL